MAKAWEIDGALLADRLVWSRSKRAAGRAPTSGDVGRSDHEPYRVRDLLTRVEELGEAA
jgi:hypothetical protein